MPKEKVSFFQNNDKTFLEQLVKKIVQAKNTLFSLSQERPKGTNHSICLVMISTWF